MKIKLLSFDFTTPIINNKTSKTVFEWKQTILVIAPFLAITLFFACSNDQSNENIWKLSENYLKIIWKLSENYMKIIWKLSENFLKIWLNLQTDIQTY